MSLYLVQHGKCYSSEENPDRPLTDEGKKEIRRISETARGYAIQVSEIFHSGKTRARESARIISEYLAPAGGIKELSGMNPNDDVKAFFNRIKSYNKAMFVGHMPFLKKLASLMVTGSEGLSVFKFQNGGILCLEREPDSDLWVIKWALMPNID